MAPFFKAHSPLWFQGHEEAAVHPLGQLRQHLGLATAQHHRRQRQLDLIEPATADDTAGVVAQRVLIQHLPGRAQAVQLDELLSLDQFFTAFLQRRAGQHQRIRADNTLERAPSCVASKPAHWRCARCIRPVSS